MQTFRLSYYVQLKYDITLCIYCLSLPTLWRYSLESRKGKNFECRKMHRCSLHFPSHVCICIKLAEKCSLSTVIVKVHPNTRSPWMRKRSCCVRTIAHESSLHRRSMPNQLPPPKHVEAGLQVTSWSLLQLFWPSDCILRVSSAVVRGVFAPLLFTHGFHPHREEGTISGEGMKRSLKAVICALYYHYCFLSSTFCVQVRSDSTRHVAPLSGNQSKL